MEGASGRQRVNPPLGWCSSPDSSLPTSALLPFLPASFTTSSGLGSPSRAPSPELSYRRASLPPSTQHRSSGAARPASFLPDQPCPSPPVMNLFRFLGDLSHLLAIILLLLKIWKSRSCAGESPPPRRGGGSGPPWGTGKAGAPQVRVLPDCLLGITLVVLGSPGGQLLSLD